MRITLSLVIGLLAAGVACAGSCVTPVRFVHHAPVVNHAVNHVVEVRKELVFVAPFFLGAVNVGYGGVSTQGGVPPVVHPAPQASSFEQKALSLLEKVDGNIRTLDNNVKTLHSDVRSLEERVKVIEAARGVTPPVRPQTPDPFAKPQPPVKQGALNLNPKEVGSVYQTRCASCHTEGKLAAKTKFTMFSVDNKLLTFTDKQNRRILTKVTSRQMPPPESGELPADEYETIVKHMDALN